MSIDTMDCETWIDSTLILGLREREQQLAARHAARTHLDGCRATLAGKLTIEQ